MLNCMLVNKIVGHFFAIGKFCNGQGTVFKDCVFRIFQVPEIVVYFVF